MKQIEIQDMADRWKSLYTFAGFATILMLIIIPNKLHCLQFFQSLIQSKPGFRCSTAIGCWGLFIRTRFI